MSDIPADPIAAIDWLLDPMAADRRFQWHAQTVLRKARAALAAHREAGAWQPIQTCSVEQSQAGCIVAADGAVGEARWHGHDEGWYWAGNDPTDAWGWRIEPTHWQPLPPAPAAEQTGGA